MSHSILQRRKLRLYKLIFTKNAIFNCDKVHEIQTWCRLIGVKSEGTINK